MGHHDEDFRKLLNLLTGPAISEWYLFAAEDWLAKNSERANLLKKEVQALDTWE